MNCGRRRRLLGQERDDICIIDRAEEFDSGLISSEESISIRHFNFSKCK
jgi:hypothetical protein